MSEANAAEKKHFEPDVDPKDIQVLAPPGAMVEVTIEHMDEGRVIQQLNNAIQQNYRDLLEYVKNSMDTKAKSTVTLKITQKLYEGNLELVEQQAKVTTTVPTLTRTSIVKNKGGKLLCQPIGSNMLSPDQMAFFDVHGNPVSAILLDRTTGEEIKQVAGRIGSAKS